MAGRSLPPFSGAPWTPRESSHRTRRFLSGRATSPVREPWNASDVVFRIASRGIMNWRAYPGRIWGRSPRRVRPGPVFRLYPTPETGNGAAGDAFCASRRGLRDGLDDAWGAKYFGMCTYGILVRKSGRMCTCKFIGLKVLWIPHL